MTDQPLQELVSDPALVHEHDAFAALSDRELQEPANDSTNADNHSPDADNHGNDDEHTTLLDDDELNAVVQRWREIQAEFVDEPRQAVHDADQLVGDLMQRLSAMFALERDHLEARWSTGRPVDSEELRQGLLRYRAFFERLLAA